MVPESIPTRRSVERNPEAVAIGSLFLLLLAVYAWATWVTKVGYAPLSNLVASNVEFVLSNRIRAFVLPAFLTNIVGIGLGAWLYARVRNVDIPFGLPSGSRLRTTVPILLVVPLLVTITALTGYVVFGTPIFSPRYAPGTRLSHLVFSSVVPALLAGFGYGLVFFGVVHRRLRDVTTPRHAVALTPLLVGFFWAVRGGARRVARLDVPLLEAATLLLVLSSGVAFGASLGLLYRGTYRAPVDHLLRARYAPVFAFGLFGAGAVVTSIADSPTGLVDTLRLVAFGVAAYGYERTRSIWVPVLVVATFSASIDVAVYLEAVTGVV